MVMFCYLYREASLGMKQNQPPASWSELEVVLVALPGMP
jgi:hypothetical protein